MLLTLLRLKHLNLFDHLHLGFRLHLFTSECRYTSNSTSSDSESLFQYTKITIIVCDPVTPKVLPNVKLPLSSISPPVPAVQHDQINHFKCICALISTKPTNVEIPATKRFVGLI